MPLVSAGSHREPDLIQIPMATERKCSMRSVRTIRPFGRTVRRRFRSVFMAVGPSSSIGWLSIYGIEPASGCEFRKQTRAGQAARLHGREEMLYAGPRREGAI